MRSRSSKEVLRLLLLSRERLPKITLQSSVLATSNTFKICHLTQRPHLDIIHVLCHPCQACPTWHSYHPSSCRWCSGTISRWWSSTSFKIEIVKVVLKTTLVSFAPRRTSIYRTKINIITISVVSILAKMTAQYPQCLPRSVPTGSCSATSKVQTELCPSTSNSTTGIMPSRAATSHQSNSRGRFTVITTTFWKLVSQDPSASTCQANRESRIADRQTTKKCLTSPQTVAWRILRWRKLRTLLLVACSINLHFAGALSHLRWAWVPRGRGMSVTKSFRLTSLNRSWLSGTRKWAKSLVRFQRYTKLIISLALTLWV